MRARIEREKRLDAGRRGSCRRAPAEVLMRIRLAGVVCIFVFVRNTRGGGGGGSKFVRSGADSLCYNHLLLCRPE